MDKALKKQLQSHCSPSRLNSFLNNKREFLQHYVFKRDKQTKKAQQKGKDIHEIFYLSVSKKRYEVVCQPDFGDLRTTEGKKKKEEWALEASDKTKLEKDEYGVFIALKAFMESNPKTREALKRAAENNKQGFEKTIYTDEPKIKGVADILTDKCCLDIKTTYTSNWLNYGEAERFFKYKSEEMCIQGVFYTEILKRNFKSDFDFYWLLTCSSYPYGIKIVDFEPEFFNDVRDLVFKKYLPNYEKFCDQVRQALGYDFYERDGYEGDEIDDWVKMNKILGNCDDYIEEAQPSYYEKQALDIRIGRMWG